MKLTKFIAFLMVVALVALTACSENNSQGEARAEEKAAASEYNTQYSFVTEKLDGSELNMADYQGKVVIVDMWDTWCPPCRKGIPEFVELYNDYKDQGFVVVGLAFGRDGRDAVEQFVADYGVTYVNGFVNQDVINKLGQPTGIPTTFILDQNGNLFKKYVGYREKTVFKNDIETLLNS